MGQTFEHGMVTDLGQMDIYLIDQIQKGRITPASKVLAAGFGHGRNLEFFVKNNVAIYGIEKKVAAIPIVRKQVYAWNHAYPTDRFIAGVVEQMPYEDDSFDFVASIAVLHFAQSHQHYEDMFNEMVRVVKPGGYILIRMTSWHTFTLAEKTEDGLVQIADGQRYMLDLETLKVLMARHHLTACDPIKTVNVEGHRTMTTLMLQKSLH